MDVLIGTFGKIFPSTDLTTAGGWLQLYAQLLVIAAGFAATTFVAKWASDETGGRLETVLATPLSRARWVLAGGVSALMAVFLVTACFAAGIALGLGYRYGSTNYAGSSMKVSGVGGTFGFALGAAIAPNLVIYGELLGTSVSDPTLGQDGVSATATGVTATMAGMGPGAAYYLAGNMYASATLLFTKLSFSDSSSSDQLASTEWGFGGALTFGKEWWVSRDWGLGASGQFLAASMKDTGASNRWTGISASVLFSATYN